MKLYGKSGFTLAEVLVVIAIVGILISISVPMFYSYKEKAKHAVDLSNVRSAKAMAIAKYLEQPNGSFVCFYDANNGCIQENKESIIPYGVSNKDFVEDGCRGIAKDGIIKVSYDENLVLEWVHSSSNLIENILKSSSIQDFDELKKKGKYGLQIDAGTILSDGTHTCVIFSNNDYFNKDLSNMRLDEFMKTYKNRITTLDASTNVLKQEDFDTHMKEQLVLKGTIISYKDSYYILKQDTYYNYFYTLDQAMHEGKFAKIKS